MNRGLGPSPFGEGPFLLESNLGVMLIKHYI